MISDPVEALIGEAWVNAVLCQREDGTQFWATPDLSKLSEPTDWRHYGQGDGRVQAGGTPKRKARSKGEKPEAGNSNCSI